MLTACVGGRRGVQIGSGGSGNEGAYANGSGHVSKEALFCRCLRGRLLDSGATDKAKTDSVRRSSGIKRGFLAVE